MSNKHLIVLVHGIRDTGTWFQDLKDFFESQSDEYGVEVKVEGISPDTVDIFRFISPTTIFRKTFIHRVEDHIRPLLSDSRYRDHHKTIIAHSFGTYIVSQILHENIDIEVDKLILCGNIVPNDFRWDRVLKTSFTTTQQTPGKASVPKVINDYSIKDIWPILAKVMAFGYGNGGSRGIQRPDIQDRKHYIGHGDYLNEQFAKDYWVPFIFEHKVASVPDPEPSAGHKLPWFFFFTRVPINWMAVAVMVLGLYCSATLVYNLSHIGGVSTALAFNSAGQDDVRIPEIKFEGYESSSASEQDVRMYVQPTRPKSNSSSLWVTRSASIKPIEHLVIEVSKRPPPSHCVYDENPEMSSADMHKLIDDWTKERTRYEIVFKPAGMWANIFDWNFSGQAKFEFEYDSRKVHTDQREVRGEEFQTDHLKIIPKIGVDSQSVSVKVQPKSRICQIDLSKTAQVHEDMFKIERQEPGTLSSMLSSIAIGSAYAGLLDNIQEVLGAKSAREIVSPDKATRNLAIQKAVDSKKDTKTLFSSILLNIGELDEEQLLELLEALPSSNSVAEVLKNEAILAQLFPLTFDNSRAIRSASRSFFRNPNVASLELASKLKALFQQQSAALNDGVLVSGNSKNYLAKVAIRDIYYNAGIARFSNSRELGRGNNSIADTVLEATEILDASGWLLETDKASERALMGKNLYAKAFVKLRFERINLVTGGQFAKYSAKDIETRMVRAAESGDKLKGESAAQVKTSFSDFLQVVAGQEDVYPWKHHIEEARNCVGIGAGVDIDCLDTR
ncbi:MAG: hypothetical protein ABJM29_08785 [Rhizobiaceae bacterium]